MASGKRVFVFTLEVVGKCDPLEAEFFLRVAAHALAETGFAVDDAQAIGIDGAPGVALDFPDPTVPVLTHRAPPDDRRLSSVPGSMH